jgi:hypothetical protein
MNLKLPFFLKTISAEIGLGGLNMIIIVLVYLLSVFSATASSSDD